MIVGLLLLLLLAATLILYLLLRLRQEKRQYVRTKKRLNRVKNQSTREKEKIQNLEETIEDLHETAYTDITTKISNRDYFIKRTLEMLQEDAEKPLTLVGFGVTNLPTVQRLYGPGEGDRLLRFVANRLKAYDLGEGFCALVQTNLFALLLRDRREGQVVELIHQISDEIEHATDIFQIETAFGIYQITDRGERVSEMLDRMVLAQRNATAREGVNYAWFDADMKNQYEENRRMCQEMEKALDERKFVMYLQPMVDLHAYQIYSAEALVRWEHEEKGLLSPYAFLPLFENTNLMLKLDYYMWEEACRTIRRWIDNKMKPLPLMLNISPIHLGNAGFITELSRLLERYKLKKDMLVLELPEHALTGGDGEVRKTVQELADCGFVLSVDNFGGMHSPVNLLRDMPFSMVKLDRKFLTENSKDEEGQTILRYLIAMAKELDLTVVVEGVETQGQVNFLTEIGCDIAQGYFFSKPVSLRDFDQLNKKIIRQGFRPTEYYPTFEDLEKDVDLMEKMLHKSGKLDS